MRFTSAATAALVASSMSVRLLCLGSPLQHLPVVPSLTTVLLQAVTDALPQNIQRDAGNSSSNSPMAQLVPGDTDFNFNVLVSVAGAPYQGSDIGEVLVAAKKIKKGDFVSFYHAFYDLASRVHDQGSKIDAKRHPVSARNTYFREATYYRSADAFLHGNWSDPRINSLWKKQTAAFNKGIALLPNPGERVELKADNVTVPAIFFKTDRPGRRPTVILGNGYDGSMEDLYHTMGEALLQRGMNALVYEGPGQPSVRRDQGLGFIPDWESVVTPVVDYAISRDDVDDSQLALMGFSFGGFLANRAAAFEPRLAAVIALDGLYDFGQAMFDNFGPQAVALFKAGKKKQLDEAVLKLQADPDTPTSLRWGIEQGKWSFKTHSAFELLKKAEKFTLKGGVVDRIKVPVFVGEAESDMFFPGQAPLLAEKLGDRATHHLFEDVQGAGLHCQIGAFVTMNQVSLDWLEDVFSNRTRTCVEGA